MYEKQIMKTVSHDIAYKGYACSKDLTMYTMSMWVIMVSYICKPVSDISITDVTEVCQLFFAGANRPLPWLHAMILYYRVGANVCNESGWLV